MTHEILKTEAKDAIARLFRDSTVSRKVTKESLIELKEDIEMRIEAL